MKSEQAFDQLRRERKRKLALLAPQGICYVEFNAGPEMASAAIA
jgi:hypothetical protein